MSYKNMEVVERLIRFMFGLVLFLIFYKTSFSMVTDFFIVFLAFLMIFSGIFGWSYFYSLFEINSRELKPLSVSVFKKEMKEYSKNDK